MARRVLTIALLAVALGVGIWLGLKIVGQPEELEIAGIYIDETKALDPFELTDGAGKPFTGDRFKNRWSFLYFGYTYCPDACPLTLSELNQVEKNLAMQGLNENTAYLLISVDPKRDKPERLAEYTEFFNPKFEGATGQPEQIDKLAKPLGVYYSVPEEPEDPDNYLVDHSSAVILINPNAELQALFTPPHDPARISADFAAIRERFDAAN